MAQKTTRFNVQLDERHAMKLHELAERTHMNPGTLARSLLSTALEQAAPNPASIVELLDAIPGALERAQQGLREAEAGQGIPLDQF
jgi:predicted transcriptional regulator